MHSLVNLAQHVCQVRRIGGINAGRCMFMIGVRGDFRVMSSIVVPEDQLLAGVLILVCIV
ncbi:MAG: hypothetical protein B6I35_11045 [Anaerolineaceae bacterium 4572_32.2]|nr:MAG: hypothetical protein B6I35_11045 [Anaerolineaceae bacterium 4572_32.2]